MKITRLGPSRPLLTVGGALTGGIGGGGTGAPPGQVPTSIGSNGSIAFGSNVGVITVNGTTQVLGPYVNFADGSNTTVTVDMVGAVGSNTIRVHATGGGGGGGLSDQGEFTYLDAVEAAAPATPASGRVRIYAKADGRVYSKDDAGVEYGPFDTAGGGAAAGPSGPVPPLDTISTWYSMFGKTTGLWASTNVTTANRAFYVPVIVPEGCTARKVFYVTGGTTTGAANVDMGIYNTSGTRLVSTGSTAYNQNNNNTFTVIDIADTALTAGLYYLAFVISSVSNVHIRRIDLGVMGQASAGVLAESSALPLPSTATWVIPTTDQLVPLIGILVQSSIT